MVDIPGILKPRTISDILVDDGVKPGVYRGVPTDKHHARRRMSPSSLASGILSHKEVDPSSIRQAWEEGFEFSPAQQDRMDRGTLAGYMLTQPERLATDVAIWTGGDRKGALWDAFQAEHAAKLIVRKKDFETVSYACSQFRFNREIVSLLSEVDVEVEMLTKEGRIFCSGQVDIITRGPIRKIIDLKTTDAGITERSVERTIREMCYREKMAAYKYWYERESGEEVFKCCNLFLKLTKPLAIRLVEFETVSLQWGYARIQEALESVDKCLARNEWPIYMAKDTCGVAPFEMDEADDITFDGETV